jgi:hypothetical protein
MLCNNASQDTSISDPPISDTRSIGPVAIARHPPHGTVEVHARCLP